MANRFVGCFILGFFFVNVVGCTFMDSGIYIEGQVFNEEGRPLSGVNVTLASEQGVTDANGEFCLSFMYPDSDIELSLSGAGYKEAIISAPFGDYAAEVSMHSVGSGSGSSIKLHELEIENLVCDGKRKYKKEDQ